MHTSARNHKEIFFATVPYKDSCQVDMEVDMEAWEQKIHQLQQLR
jgi:hypothetical protein